MPPERKGGKKKPGRRPVREEKIMPGDVFAVSAEDEDGGGKASPGAFLMDGLLPAPRASEISHGPLGCARWQVRTS